MKEIIPFKEILKSERKKRGWSQKDLGNKINGVPANTVSRWERGLCEPDSYNKQALRELLGMELAELGLFNNEQDANILNFWNVPFFNPQFTGREDFLKQLEHGFHSQPIQVLYGLAGMGKTQVAAKYAHGYHNRYPTHKVFWINASTRESLHNNIVKLAEHLQLVEKDFADQSMIKTVVTKWLFKQRNWLLILDNLEEMEQVRDLKPNPEKTNGRVLITTCQTPDLSFKEMANCILVEKMEEQEGVELLLKRVSKLERGIDLSTVEETVRQQAKQIVDTLNGWPLAIERAGAYITEVGCGLSGYLKLYKTQQPETVLTALSLSFNKLEEANADAANLLRLCSFLCPDTIPEEMIIQGLFLPIEGQREPTRKMFYKAVQAAQQYSLFQRDERTETLSIHRPVQVVIKNMMDLQTQRYWAEYTIKAVNRALPEIEFSQWQYYQQCLPHIQACADLIKQWRITSPEASRLLEQAGHYLSERAQYEQAEQFLTQALELREHIQGPEHPDRAKTLTYLAKLRFRQGLHTWALALYTEAKVIYEQTLGKEHLAVAQCLNDMGLVEYNRAQYKDAEKYYTQALELKKKALGPQHSDLATTLNNLAWLHYNQGRYQEVEILYSQAIDIWQQTRGELSHEAATSLNGLGMYYRALGQFEEAERYYLQALELRKEALGPEHPDVATTLNDLAWLYRNQAKYKQAKETYQQVRSIRERFLKETHPHVLTTQNDWAVLLMDMGQYQAALDILSHVLELREKALGLHHPRLASSCNNLGWLYYNMGQPIQARTYHERALQIRQHILNENHPDIARSWNALGVVYHMLGRYEEAEKHYQTALAICKDIIGQESPLRATFLNNLALLFIDQGKCRAQVSSRQDPGLKCGMNKVTQTDSEGASSSGEAF